MLERIAWYVMVGGAMLLVLVACSVAVWAVVDFIKFCREESPNG